MSPCDIPWFDDPTPAILLAGNRTGGTFLTTALSNHEQIFCARGEPLHHENPWSKLISDEKRMMHLLWKQRGYQVSMFKMNLSDLRDSRRDFLARVDNLKVIFLTREDIASQAISNEINVVFRSGGVSGHPTQAVSDAEIEIHEVKLRPRAVVDRCRSIMSNNRNTEKWLHSIDAEILHITYEQLTQGEEIVCISPEASDTICNFLGVDARLLCGTLKKIHKEPFSEVVSNWNEIHNRLHSDLRLL